MEGKYKVDERFYNNHERIYTNPDGTTPIGWNKEETYKVWTDKQFKKFKQNNNMETKKKINWKAIWAIIRDILVAILASKETIEMI